MTRPAAGLLATLTCAVMLAGSSCGGNPNKYLITESKAGAAGATVSTGSGAGGSHAAVTGSGGVSSRVETGGAGAGESHYGDTGSGGVSSHVEAGGAGAGESNAGASGLGGALTRVETGGAGAGESQSGDTGSGGVSSHVETGGAGAAGSIGGSGQAGYGSFARQCRELSVTAMATVATTAGNAGALTCSDGSAIGQTSCVATHNVAEFVCKNPGAGCYAEHQAKECAPNEFCSASACDLPETKCDGRPLGALRCNPNDLDHEYRCDGAESAVGLQIPLAWYPVPCAIGQRCVHPEKGCEPVVRTTCDKGITKGAIWCNPDDLGRTYQCEAPALSGENQWLIKPCATGHQCLHGACQPRQCPMDDDPCSECILSTEEGNRELSKQGSSLSCDARLQFVRQYQTDKYDEWLQLQVNECEHSCKCDPAGACLLRVRYEFGRFARLNNGVTVAKCSDLNSSTVELSIVKLYGFNHDDYDEILARYCPIQCKKGISPCAACLFAYRRDSAMMHRKCNDGQPLYCANVEDTVRQMCAQDPSYRDALDGACKAECEAP